MARVYTIDGEPTGAMDALRGGVAQSAQFRFDIFKAACAQLDAADAWTPERREVARLALKDILMAAEAEEAGDEA